MNNNFFAENTTIIASDYIKNKNKNFKYYYILIPVLCYKVVIPQISNKRLNFFQKIILKYLCYKNCDLDDIANNFYIDIKLVKYIIDELEGLGYYVNNTVTEEGKNALNGEIIDDNDSVAGYFFYNLVSESFLDVFVPEMDLESMKINTADSDNRDYLYMSISKGYKPQEIYIINCDNEVPKTVKKEDVFEAFIEYYNNTIDRDNMSMYDSSIENGNFVIDKIHIMNKPINYYLLSYIYYNDTNVNTGLNAVHPFLEGVYNFKFNKNIIEYSKDNRSLDKKLKELNTVSVGNYKKNYDEIFIFIESIFEDAVLFKKNKDLILKAFSELLISYKNFINSEGGNLQNKISARESLIREIYISFEIIVKGNIAGYYQYDAISDKTDENRSILDNIIARIGFEIFEDSDTSFFYGIRKSRVKKYKNETELKHLCAISVLEALENKDHYYYRLAKEDKDFFKELLTLKELRDNASHNDYEDINFKDIDRFIYYFIEFFQIVYNTKIDIDKINKLKANIKNDNTINVSIDDARKEILRKSDINIKNKKFEELYYYLSTVQYHIYLNDDIDVDITRALENMMLLLIRDIGENTVLSRVRDYLMNERNNQNVTIFDTIIEVSKEEGFTNIEKTSFLKVDFLIKRWNGSKVYNRLNKRIDKLVFTDRLMLYWIYSVLCKPENFKLIAKECSDFFAYMIKYCKREHNARLLYNVLDHDFYNNKEVVLKDVITCSNAIIKILND